MSTTTWSLEEQSFPTRRYTKQPGFHLTDRQREKYSEAHKAAKDNVRKDKFDRFCISKKFRRSLEDVRVLRGADVGSDHHLLIAKVEIKLKKHRIENHGYRIKYQVNLLQDEDKRQEFHLKLSNKFQALENIEETPIEDHWKEIKKIVTTACSSVLGPKKQIHKY